MANELCYCHGVIQKANQRFLIDGKAKFDVRKSLSKLPFSVEIGNYIYICKSCLDKLKKLDNLKRQELEVVDNLERIHKLTEYGEHSVTKIQCVELSFVSFGNVTHVPLSPVLRKAASDCSTTTSILEQSNLLPVYHSTPKKLQSACPDPTNSCKYPTDGVTVKLQWPFESKPRERHLPADLQSLGKCLLMLLDFANSFIFLQ